MMEDKDITKEIIPPNEEKKKDKRKYFILLLFLLFITTITVSYVLQHNTNQPAAIDNIPINPVAARDIHVSGQVLYDDGEPFKNGTMELHSDVQTTTTDEKGWFLFQNVKAQEHTIYAKDKNGKELAKAVVNVRQDAKNMIDISKVKDGDYVVNISAKIRFLELSIKISEGKLLLMDESTYVISDEGKVYTTKGVLPVTDETIILDTGTVITGGNVIIHFPYAVDGDNKVTELNRNRTTELSDGTKVRKDGTIILPDGSEIDIDNKVVLPPNKDGGNGNSDNHPNDEQKIPDDSSSKVEGDGTVTPIVPVPDDNQKDDNKGNDVDPTPDPKPDSKPDPTPEPKPDPDPTPTPDPDPEPTPDPDEDKGFVYRKTKVDWSNDWNASLSVDLFGDEKIKPGSSGKFIFKVENNRQSDLKLIMRIAQSKDCRLPLNFRLGQIKTAQDNLPKNQKWQSWGNKNTIELVTDKNIIGKKNEDNVIIYCMEWEWPYEGGNDEADTYAGENIKRYSLDLQIELEDAQ